MGDRGRVILIISAVVLVGLILLTRVFSSFYVDYLWHQSVGRTDVFWGVWWAKLTMFLLFGGVFVAVAILNLVIADRLAPSSFSANTHPAVERFHEFFGHRMRLLRIGVAVVIGLLFALPAMGHWQDWLMFRNSKSFGINDPEFGNDIGFYLFRLPFISFLLDWLFAAVVFITALVIGTHVLNGGIILQPPRPKVRKATKAHIAVLLAFLAVLKAGDYVVKRYELTYEASGVVRGPGYASVNAELPAIVLLALIAVLVAGLFLWTLKSGSWRLPIIASALWALIALVGGVIYPAAVQAFSVNPNKKDREAEYVARNIDATRNALGINNVEVQKIDIGTDSLSESALSNDVAPLRDVRLFRPDSTMKERFRTDKGQTTGLTINDLDVDRYSVDGTVRQELIAARELDLGGVANKSWQGTHLLSTHGCGLVSAPAGVATTSGRPVYIEKDLDRPELYFSEKLNGYAVVNTTVKEGPDCDTSSDGGHYNGAGGVQLDSTIKRLAFALDYLDYNLFASSAISDDSRLISVRSVSDRVREIAPFLSIDGDPYPVALDGRVLWVVDGYTTSDRYPYGENGDRNQLSDNTGLNKPFNYVRNSVKAVVDGYDGTVRMYVVDDNDPVIKVWRSAFPNLFLPKADMPDGLLQHLRYPEDIFRVQTAAYAKYRLAADAFFSRDGLWSVAQAAQTLPSTDTAVSNGTDTETANTEAQQAPTDFAADSSSARFEPYYSIFHPPNNGPVQFAMFRPFVLFASDDGRKEMQAYMTASSDPDSYGQLTVYDINNAIKPDGPATITSTMNSDTDLSEAITLLSRGGSQVEYGDLQMFSIGGSVLWVRPLYVVSVQTNQPTLRYVVVYYNTKVSFGTSLRLALAPLFPGFDTDLGDVQGGDGGNGSGEPVDPGGNTDKTPAQLLQEAQQLFDDAEAVLKKDGAAGLGEYQAKVAEAQALVQQALDILDAAQQPDTGTTDPGTDDTTPDSTPATTP